MYLLSSLPLLAVSLQAPSPAMITLNEWPTLSSLLKAQLPVHDLFSGPPGNKHPEPFARDQLGLPPDLPSRVAAWQS